MRLGQAIAALQELAARGVDSCRPGHVEAMRQAALLTGPIKQIMLIAANGEVLCTDPGGLAARQEVLTSTATADSGIMLDVIRLADRGERFLRIRKAGAAGPARPGRAGAGEPAACRKPRRRAGSCWARRASRCPMERRSGIRA